MNAPERLLRRLPALNPVMVKELRQFVRSRVMLAALMLLLAVLLITITVFALSTSVERVLGGDGDLDGGRRLFTILLPILNAVCVFCVPGYCAMRLTSERSAASMDLLFTTAVGPAATIRGKLYSGVVVTALVYSIATPFLALTYLLRGIDLPTILFCVGAMVLLNIVAVQAGICYGAIPASKALKAILGLFVAFQLLGIVPLGIALTQQVITSGMGGAAGSGVFWGVVATSVGAAAAVLVLFHVLSVVMIMPPASNRALPLRLALVLLWLGSGAAAMLWFVPGGTVEALQPWIAVTTAVCAGVVLMAVSERERLGPRVLSTVPRRLVARLFVFPLYSGTAGGLLWAVLVAGITLGGGYTAAAGLGVYRDTVPAMTLFLLYILGYALTAAWVRRTFLARLVPHRITWVLALMFITLGALVPSLAGFIRSSGTLAVVEGGQYGNVFASFDDQYRDRYLLFAGVWALAALALNVPWLLRQAAAFRPPPAADRHPLDAPVDGVEAEAAEPPPLPPPDAAPGGPAP